MNFVEIQIIIFLSVLISALIGGKKATLIASGIWVIETIIVYRMSSANYLQIITVTLSFQIGMLIAIIRDFIVKKIKKIRNQSKPSKEVS